MSDATDPLGDEQAIVDARDSRHRVRDAFDLTDYVERRDRAADSDEAAALDDPHMAAEESEAASYRRLHVAGDVDRGRPMSDFDFIRHVAQSDQIAHGFFCRFALRETFDGSA